MKSNEFDVQRNPSDWWFACVDVDIWGDESLSTIDKSVFTVLCIHASVRGRQCKLKIETIAKKASCSVRSVQNSLKKLTERGLIKREECFHEGKQISSRFLVVGHLAPCYRDKMQEDSCDEGCTTCGPRNTCTGGVQDVRTDNDNSFNDIKDSLTREAQLPDYDDLPLAFENGEPVITESPKPDNPEEVCVPEDAPHIMKSTAELFLHKTGRKGLTWEEISALRELAASQFPSRVQKEIDTACRRFLKRGQSLSTLTFGYIAGALKYQHSRSPKKHKHKPEDIPVHSNDNAEAEMARIEALQAKFDAEARI